MKRLILAVVIAALAAAPVAAALDRAETRSLLRVAVKLSGLKAQGQVWVVVESPPQFNKRRVSLLERGYPRTLQNYDETVYRALGLLDGGKGTLRKALIEMENRSGVYDPIAATAYVKAGPTERATALHELVHALQDQHYDLRRAARLSNSDARVAATAAIEGHAALVADVLAPRTTSARSNDNLTRFLELERGFAYQVGLRFAADLRNLGGRSALLGALQRFPATSEQVFHLDKYLEREPAAAIILPVDAAGMRLAGDSSFGELDVRALMAVFDVPRLDRVGSGWGGGRSALYRGAAGEAVLVALDWDTEHDAAEWAEAVEIYVNEAFDADNPGLLKPVPCSATRCWELGGSVAAFTADGRRTRLVLAPSTPLAAELAAAVL